MIPQVVGSAADGPEFTISWVPKVLEAREGNRRRTWSTSPRSSSARAPCPCRGRTRTSRRRPTSRARRSASGTSATSSRSPPARKKAGLDAGHRLREGHPAVRHDPAAVEADRRRRGDDLQRVRPGARGDEPGDRRALPADRPQRHQLERRGHGDAPGRPLRPGGVARRSRQRGHRDPLPARPRSRAGSTAGPTRPTASSTRSTRAPRSAPATRPG